jgi:glycine/D-amino acid oxidase-like deaminating enzyme
MRTDVVKPAARVLDLLELLAAVPAPVRLTAVAEHMAIPKSGAFALLGTLVAKRMCPGLSDRGAEFWMGCRPSTPDSLPVIDRASRVPNVIYAFGHGHTGLTGAPITGELVAALATDDRPPIDPAPYGLGRFD